MPRINRIKKMVQRILTYNPRTRNDDGFLFFCYLQNQGIKLEYSESLVKALNELKTVVRVRRKFQEKNQFLSWEKVKILRELNQEEFKNWSLNQ